MTPSAAENALPGAPRDEIEIHEPEDELDARNAEDAALAVGRAVGDAALGPIIGAIENLLIAGDGVDVKMWPSVPSAVEAISRIDLTPTVPDRKSVV